MKRDCELHPIPETESREDKLFHLQEQAIGETRPVLLVALKYLERFPLVSLCLLDYLIAEGSERGVEKPMSARLYHF